MVTPTTIAIPPMAIAQRTPDDLGVAPASPPSRATVWAGAVSSAGSTGGRPGSAQVGPCRAQVGVGVGVGSVGPGASPGVPAAGSDPGGGTAGFG